tara:strand:+ start:3365 stop:3595 length:231 start_codon:yes stop_codon:yes gene_type:complete
MTKRQRAIAEDETAYSTPVTSFGGRRSVRESISLRFPTEEETPFAHLCREDSEEVKRALERIEELKLFIRKRRGES